MIKKINTEFEFSDKRGKLVQLIHDGYKQINVLSSNKGVIRGGHYHKRTTEAFYVICGSVNVTVSKDGISNQLSFQTGDFFVIDPYTVHSMYFPEDCTMVQMYSIPVEDNNGEKDIISC